MKQIFKYIGIALMGGLIGIISALLMSGLMGTHRPNLSSSFAIKHWQTDWAIGEKSSSPYMRAYISRRGLLALPKTEAVYFIRNVDNDGARLSSACTYKLMGGPQKAQWWSITLYDSADRLPDNEDGAYSIDQTRLGAEDWSVEVRAANTDANKPWLSSHNAGDFDLMIRLYKPQQSLLTSPREIFNPPSIEKIQCREKSS